MQNPSRKRSRRLRPIFSVERRRLSSNGLAEARSPGNRFDLVIGRELCLYARFDASHIPPKSRAGFLDLSVRRAAPFPDPAYDAGWIGDVAHVWYWSRGRVAELLGVEREHVRRTFAEALLLGGVPAADSIEAFSLVSGIEARAWRDGALKADRWWPAEPTASEWTAFLRDAGTVEAADFPAPHPPAWRETPWGKKSQRSGLPLGEWSSRAPLLVSVGAGVLFAAAAMAELGAGARALYDARETDRIKRLEEQKAQDVLAARSRADAASAGVDEAIALMPPRSTIAMLAEVSRLMPGPKYQLLSWVQPNIDHLEVVAVGGDADVEALVSSWEGSAMFSEASAQYDETTKRVTVKAKVLGASESATAVEAAASQDMPRQQATAKASRG